MVPKIQPGKQTSQSQMKATIQPGMKHSLSSLISVVLKIRFVLKSPIAILNQYNVSR